MRLTRQQFERRVRHFWSEEIYEQCKDKIEPCTCGSVHCQGWVMPVTAADWAAASLGLPEGRLEV